MLRRAALLLWVTTSLGCPAEGTSQAAITPPPKVEAPAEPKAEVKAEAEPAKEGEAKEGEAPCCGAEGPTEVALPPEDEAKAQAVH
jgi:hypothetical protein